MRKTGPNDAFCVVWAIGMWFFFVHVLLVFFVFFRFYLCSKMTGRVGLGGDEKNRPKRCKMRCLGHRFVIFFFPFVFNLFFLFYLGSVHVLNDGKDLVGW